MMTVIDSTLHTLAGLVGMLVLWALHALLPFPFFLAAAVSLILYVREWTQASIESFDKATGSKNYDARLGWNPLEWSAGKNIETWVPCALLHLAALLAWLISG
jgi:hypothetical protein